MHLKTLLLVFSIALTSCNTISDGKQVLERAIEYHDPGQRWDQFKGTLEIEMTTPDQSVRYSEVFIDLPGNTFTLKTERDSTQTFRTWKDGQCTFSLNGVTDLTPEEMKKHRGTCERTTMMKNYYTYLYGLPMKLMDPGSRIGEEVERKTFMGKEYLVVRVDYDPEVGQDVWCFYFDPETYAMEAYQFFKDETTGQGEYILLEETMDVQGMKIPKSRAWYTNKGKYLGTDLLIGAE
ncbi:DUF6503 family protein [Robertkochia flava]|uniref:DUF6503 family protein n=1 Tax=Robertkochia flava TaxID=3447986 RepID=UPI001CCD0269|nr:DUF6503 family protein [Robertkochia marina]